MFRRSCNSWGFNEHAEDVLVTHGEQLVLDRDVGPLRAQPPRAGDDSRVHKMPVARMGPFAILQFITATRRTNRHDLSLLRSESRAVGLGEHNAAPAQGFGGGDGFDEAEAR